MTVIFLVNIVYRDSGAIRLLAGDLITKMDHLLQEMPDLPYEVPPSNQKTSHTGMMLQAVDAQEL